jgi:lantibiotic modifying enzyme
VTGVPWQPVLSGATARRALELAGEVGRRLADPTRLAQAIDTASRQRGADAAYWWAPTALSNGHPGLSLTLAHVDRCFQGQGWGRLAHRHLVLSVEALRAERRATAGLFSGLAGVAFAAHSVGGRDHSRLLETLDGLLARHTERLIARLDGRDRGAAREDFDVVSGLSGVGAYYLTRGDDAGLRRVVERLVRLVLADGETAGWCTPPELLDEDSAGRFPEGALDCGFAHGLPGPLALLALASSKGLSVERLRPALVRGSAWVVERVEEDEWGVNWPAAVPAGRGSASAGQARAGWCYGAPGVARTLWLAGEALGNGELQAFAVDALEAVHRRPPDRRRIPAPTFCHGSAGLLQITLRMAADSRSRTLRESGAGLALELAERFEDESALGYRDLDPGGRSVDAAGILNGAAGPALALLAAAAPVAPDWDRMFLVA